MSGIMGALLNSAQALSVQSKGVEIAGKNIANVNNTSYARQRVIMKEGVVIQTDLGPQSMGVTAAGIQGIRDKFLDAQVTREVANTSYLESQANNLTTAQTDLAEVINTAAGASSVNDTTQSGTGLSSAITNFFNKFETYASNPTDAGTKQALLGQANTLVNQFNATDARLAGLQDDIGTQINTDVTAANSLLKEIADLNGQVQAAEVGAPGSAADLRDLRQARLEELAQYMDFSAAEVPGQFGQIAVVSNTTPPVTLVDRVKATGTLTYDGNATFSWDPGLPATPVALDIQAGSLKGNVVSKTGTIQDLRDGIRTTADQLVKAVNTAYNPLGYVYGVTDYVAGVVKGGDFFTALPAAPALPPLPVLKMSLGLGLSLGTLKADITGDAGGNAIALNVAQVATKILGAPINGTIGGYYNTTATTLGQTASTINSRLTDQQSVEDLVRTQRDSVSGVSEDEEMTDLMKYQRAFQGISRVISVMDDLLDNIINQMGR